MIARSTGAASSPAPLADILRRVFASPAFKVVDDDRDMRRVARREEARQRHQRHDRVAHRHRGARRTELVRAIRHRHQPQLALEIGDVELDRCRAVASSCTMPENSATIRLLLSGRAGDRPLGKLVAAAAQDAQRIGARIDEPAVEVAQFDAEAALAIEIFFRRRAVKICQLEHCLIDRGEGHVRLLARGEPGHLERDVNRPTRPHDGGLREAHGQRPRRRVDAEPGDPDGPARPVLLRTRRKLAVQDPRRDRR